MSGIESVASTGVLAGVHMDVLVAIDAGYILPFKVMSRSFVEHNPGVDVTFYVMNSSIPEASIEGIYEHGEAIGAHIVPIKIDPCLFENAPVSQRYPREIYYRLAAPVVLPQTLDRVLYLDSDILLINPVAALWELDLGGNVFAAAPHNSFVAVTRHYNYMRLRNRNPEYFNSGVILMDLARARELVRLDDLFDCVKTYQKRLHLPDQDVFNMLYGAQTRVLDETVWNYDVRYAPLYRLRTKGRCDFDWIMQNTAVLHFCGKKKPWKKPSRSRFHTIYQRYFHMVV